MLHPLKMSHARGLLLVLLLARSATVFAGLSAEKLTGTWECYVDYETHILKFISPGQFEFDGERQFYTLKTDAVEVDYNLYPCRFEGEALIVTADGRDIRFTRVAKDEPPAPVQAKDLLGYWKSQTDWGVQYLNIISDTELEAGGERNTYTLMPNAVRVNGSDYPYSFENDKLTVTIPEEGRKVTFMRDDSVFMGAWVAEINGMTVPLVVLSEDELEYDYQYTTYEHIPGAVRVEGMDYPYHFEGKALVAQIDGREVRFQRDVTQFLGTWQGSAQGRDVSITFLPGNQVSYEDKLATYTLLPGSIHVDGKCLPYRLSRGKLVVVVPEEGEVVLKKVRADAKPSWKTFQGTWQGQRDWETIRLRITSASQLSYNGEIFDYTLLDGVVRVEYEDYPYRIEGDTLMVTIDGTPTRFTRMD